MVSRILNLLFKFIRKGEFGKDGMHLGIVLTRLAEYVYDMSARSRFPFLPEIDYCSHFHSIALFKVI